MTGTPSIFSSDLFVPPAIFQLPFNFPALVLNPKEVFAHGFLLLSVVMLCVRFSVSPNLEVEVCPVTVIPR